MQGIKSVILDLGGVILNLDISRSEAAFVAMGLKDFHDYFHLGFAGAFFKDYEIGKIDDRQFIDALKEHSGLKASDEKIIEAWDAMLLDFPPARIDFIKSLARRYRLFLFSNTNALHHTAFHKTYRATIGGNFDDQFEKAYYSHLLGMRKPDKAPFEYILKENNLIGAETLFVDDVSINVEGANAVGLQGVHLRPGMDLVDIPLPT